MKVFWSIIVLASLSLGLTYALPGDDGRAEASAIQTAHEDSPQRAGARPATSIPDNNFANTADDAAATNSSPATADNDVLSVEMPVASSTSPAASLSNTSTAIPVAADEAAPGIAGTDSEKTVVGLSELIASLADAGTEAESELVAVESDASTSTEAEAPSDATAPAGLALDRRDLPNGTTLINDRFVLAGKGTKDAPYEITWDYLTSARETYLPRDGKTEIPPHIAMLEGTYVRIGGYVTFPLASPEPKELLIMLNQWDGCCIGLPPTPYDAIEVSLATPATRDEKFAVEGVLVGKLKIDPYLVGDWLIGLYIIGDATLDVSGSRSAEEVYGNSPTVGHPNAMPD
ncbi:MAG: hypothetical protein AAGB48_02675 [Planctomycetota bacterium]